MSCNGGAYGEAEPAAVAVRPKCRRKAAREHAEDGFEKSGGVLLQRAVDRLTARKTLVGMWKWRLGALAQPSWEKNRYLPV